MTFVTYLADSSRRPVDLIQITMADSPSEIVLFHQLQTRDRLDERIATQSVTLLF